MGGQSVAVKIQNLKGKSYNFGIKQTSGSSWSHMTAAEKTAADLKKKADEPKMDKDDPSAGLMNIMKKMYDEGDDEMKRTIAKAWTEGQDKRNKDGLEF